MPDTYRVEVGYYVDGDSFPAPGDASFTSRSTAPETSVVLVAVDGTSSSTRWFSIVSGIYWVSASEFRSFAELRFGTNIGGDDHRAGGTLLQTLEGSGQGAFLNGGTLAIEKDEAANAVRFTTPVGSYTHSLSALGVQNAEAIKGERLIAYFINGNWAVPDDWDQSFHWYGFWSDKSGERFRGAAMSSAQPGVWNPLTEPGTKVVVTELQNPTEYQMLFALVVGSVGTVTETATRPWAGGDTIADIALYLDLCRDPDTGTLWYARVVKQAPEKIKVGYSHDGGLTWTEVNGCDCPARHNQTPSLTFVGRHLILFWNDGTGGGEGLNHAVSETLGRTWSDPTTHLIPLVGRIDSMHTGVDPTTGRLMLVYRVASGAATENLQVEAAAAPGEIAFDEPPNPALLTLLGEPAYPELQPFATGVFHLSYSQSGNKRQFRSDSHGVNWAEHYNIPGPETHPTHRQYNGLTYHLYWHTDQELRAYYDTTVGEDIFHPPAVVVATGVAEQRADIEITPKGGQIVAYQVYDAATDRWNVMTKRSDDYTRTWS